MNIIGIGIKKPAQREHGIPSIRGELRKDDSSVIFRWI